MRRLAAALLALVLLAGPAPAVQPDEVLKDAGLEARARALSAGLRCLVCQNQSIDDSDAELARDLRLLVRDRLKAGDSDAAVTAFVVARYGEFVLLKPVFARHTWLLWLTPLVVLALGGIGAYAASRRRATATPALDLREQDALSRILHEPDRPASG